MVLYYPNNYLTMIHFLQENKIQLRAGCANGLWVLFLLPMSVIISVIKYPLIASPTYKLVSLCCIGFVISSLEIIQKKSTNQRLNTLNVGNLLGIFFITFAANKYLQKDWPISLFTGITVTCLYTKLFLFILRNLEKCFTIGEAGLASQAVIISLYSLLMNVITFLTDDNFIKSNVQVFTITIQLGLLGIGIIAWAVYMLNIREAIPFYITSFLIISTVILLPLHIVLNKNPLFWVFQLLFYDSLTVKFSCYWICCCLVAALAINRQIRFAKKASTGTRKIFHVVALFIFIPGLLYRCSLLYLASGIMTGIFFFLEIVRVLRVPPIGRYLQEGFIVFCDEKDAGNLALTPIYLLVSCSLPLWIHPSPCDLTDSAIFEYTPLLSGLLAIGVGDTAASIVGSNYGKNFWSGSNKTIEGTIAFVIFQIIFLHLLIYIGYIPNLSKNYLLWIYVSFIVTSLVEARTNQIDNLVLPFLMYILLI